MLADSHIAGEVQRRKLALQGSYYECKADIILWDTIETLFEAIICGAELFEIYMENGKMLFEPYTDSVLQYSKDDGFFVQTSTNQKLNPKEDSRLYLVTTRKAALFPLIWIFAAKHYVLSNYMGFTKLLGIPPIVVTADSSDATDIYAIADMVEQLVSASIGVFSKDTLVKLLEGKGSQADFLEFVKYCDTEISLNIVGNTLSGNTSANGGAYAQAKVHQDSFAAITKADTIFTETHVNALLGRCGKTKDFKYIIEAEKDLKTRAEVLKILKELGYEVRDDYIEKEFDLPAKSTPQITANRKEANAKEPNTADKIDEEAIAADTRPIEREIAERMEAILANTKSFEQAHAALIAAYPDIELAQLEATLERLIANSYIQGRSEI